MKTVSFALASLAILASVATAQQQVPVQKVTGVKSFQIGVAQPKSTSAVVYTNTLNTGYYSVPGPGEEWIDYGSARDLSPLPEHGTIIYGSLGYATSSLTGPGLVRWRTYDGYTGGCTSLSPGGLDVSISGLPGHIFTTGGTGWTVGLNLAGAGACFYLPTGPFGYSMTFSDSLSGPLLRSGDSSANRFDWIFASTGSCGTYWFGGSPWAGFHTEFIGWKASASAGLGANGPIALSIAGNSCPGGAITISIASTPPAAFSAVGIGIVIGAGIGGPLPGGVAWDIGLAPGVPPISAILGLFPGTISFPATTPAGAAPGAVFAAQWVQKVGPVVSTSNVAVLYVP
jgi:hypothetical protein